MWYQLTHIWESLWQRNSIEQELSITESDWLLLLSGNKYNTIRSGYHHINKGPLSLYCTKLGRSHLVIVQQVTHKRLVDLQPTDVLLQDISDSASVQRAIQVLANYYPDLYPNSSITVIYFDPHLPKIPANSPVQILDGKL